MALGAMVYKAQLPSRIWIEDGMGSLCSRLPDIPLRQKSV